MRLKNSSSSRIEPVKWKAGEGCIGEKEKNKLLLDVYVRQDRRRISRSRPASHGEVGSLGLCFMRIRYAMIKVLVKWGMGISIKNVLEYRHGKTYCINERKDSATATRV